MRKRAIWYFLSLALLLLVGCLPGGADDRSEETEEGRELAVEYDFLRVADGERQEGGLVLAQDGEKVVLRREIDHGTPWEHWGILFDTQMFRAVEKAKKPVFTDDMRYEWTFTPLAPGETEIMEVNRYLVDDSLDYLVLHVYIEEDLSCRILWHEEGKIGEQYQIFEKK